MSLSDLQKILYTREQLDVIVKSIATKIDEKYYDLVTKGTRKLVLIGILKGSYMFLSDLSRHLKTPHTIEFMSVKSYSDTHSTGTVQILMDLRTSISDEYAIIVEDILDTGLTLSYLLKLLQNRQPSSLDVCVLLRKPTMAKINVDVTFLGVDLNPPEFVVGYGLDYNEFFRNLDCIGVPTQTAIDKYASK